MRPTLTLKAPDDLGAAWTAGRRQAGAMISPLYARHFGLSERPFSLLPDPSFLYWSQTHSRAYAMLDYGLTTFAPIIVITGEIGAGKTTLIRHLLTKVGSGIRVGLVANAQGERGKLLHWIMSALGQPTEAFLPYVKRFEQLVAFLRIETAQGRRVILVFDEAQNLSPAMLEELRCLSNLNLEGEELLQLILVGQPELNSIINRPDMLQFAQRVSAYFHLGPISPDTVPGYVSHRLARAGATREIFTPEACALVSDGSDGLPRVINQICDYALVHAFADGRLLVEADIVAQVVDDRRVRFARPPGGQVA